MRIRTLKTLQLAVAIATTTALAAGLLWPGAMGLLLVPVGLLYVIWATRAAFDRPFSIWLAFVSTLTVALFLGAFSVSVAMYAFRADAANDGSPAVAFDSTGSIVQAPLQGPQPQIDRRERIHAGILLLIGASAWAVIALHGLEWRWAFLRKAR